MTKDHISTQKFLEELRRYQKGSVTRRHFLGVTGLGLATAVMSSAVPGLRPRKAYAELSGTVNFTTGAAATSATVDIFARPSGSSIAPPAGRKRPPEPTPMSGRPDRAGSDEQCDAAGHEPQ